MPKYIVLANWTAQGVKNVKDSAARWDAAKEAARALGATFETIYMVMGDYDLVAILDAPNDEVVAKLLLHNASGGDFHTKTLKAFDESDYRRIIGSL